MAFARVEGTTLTHVQAENMPMVWARVGVFCQNTMHSARDKLARLSPAGAVGSPTLVSARDLYSSLPQNEASEVDVLVKAPSRPRACVDSMGCNTFIALVIMANTTVIGFECQDMNNPNNKATYHILELIFCIVYVVEIVLRCKQHGLHGFFCARDGSERGWNLFDFVTTVVGTIGVICSELGVVKVNASVLRLLRVLRIVRVFRILKFMKDIEYTLISAMTSMVRIMFLVLLIDFIGAVVVTNLLHDSPDEVIQEMFGELSSSMYHLFVVMVDGMGALHITDDSLAPGGMVVITEKVTEVHPHMRLFWIAFVFVGTISLMALVPAIFVELNMRDAELARKRSQKDDWERRVEAQRAALEAVFKGADKDNSNAISRSEMDEFLMTKDALKRIGLEKDEEDDDGVHGDHVDVRQLRMEFSMVYDTIEAEGRQELSSSEFIEAFRQMRAKPMDQVVVMLQQEIFKLRTVMSTENSKLRDEIRNAAPLYASSANGGGGSARAGGLSGETAGVPTSVSSSVGALSYAASRPLPPPWAKGKGKGGPAGAFGGTLPGANAASWGQPPASSSSGRGIGSDQSLLGR
eukprot:CAMPEP_0183534138 /NCGR_PEP_ID=MMETSP0371-20130417/26678_1 /TAXON_ID=268820 /ORGANISM="Peridinium aciculiferum, Strain PAER-2" /LENGTH=578 /DNA_ID=CAMNT_0025734469 /DNA_START=1 /DNA_END=1737 /DNA_ORIENTATION=+